MISAWAKCKKENKQDEDPALTEVGHWAASGHGRLLAEVVLGVSSGCQDGASPGKIQGKDAPGRESSAVRAGTRPGH